MEVCVYRDRVVAAADRGGECTGFAFCVDVLTECHQRDGEAK